MKKMEQQERPPNSKAKLTEVNTYLTCYLCKGYYIDATTIVECLHSFCRSCIIQYLQQDPFCPICDLMINMAKPQIKPDKTLQDIVYKLVPGLYASEMCRRRKFWAEHSEEAQRVACPEAKGLMTERIVFSPQDAISLSIEYTSDDETAWNHGQPNRIKSQQQQQQQQLKSSVAVVGATNSTNTNTNGSSSEPDPEIPLRRYLQCPAMLRVEHLKKFICNKYNVDNQQYHIDILYKRVPLPDHYTLMDIAYIYSWKRNEPMKFYFRITDIALAPERFDYFEPSSVVSSTPNPSKTRCHQQRTTKQQPHNIVNNNTIVKKTPSASPIRADSTEDNTSDNTVISDRDNKLVLDATKTTKNCDKVNNSQNQVGGVVKCKTEKRKTVVADKDKDVKPVKSECVAATDNNKKINDNNVSNSEKENIPNNNDDNKSDTDKQIKENSEVVKCADTEKRIIKQEDITTSVNKVIKSEPTEFTNTTTATTTTTSTTSSTNNVPITIKSETVETSEKDLEKSNFLKSIQLTARSSLSPPNSKTTNQPITLPKVPIPRLPLPMLKFPVGQKRKYVRKNPKEPNAKKAKLVTQGKKSRNDKTKVTVALTKMRKIAPKATKTPSPTKETDVKVRNIKNPIVRMIVSNMNKQSTNLNKIVGQTNINETERLKSLIDSCKLNIPSSLSITLTESPRNEDGTIVESKPAPIKPVQNYIEILKLPETNVPSSANASSAVGENTEKEKSSDGETVPKKSDTAIDKLNQKILDPTKNGFANMTKTQKQTFQTMFEEAIKRNESIKAQLYQIQNQAKSAENAKKASTPKQAPNKKQQSNNNALDLSSKTTSPTKVENGADSPTTNTTTSTTTTNSSVAQNLYVSTPTRALKSPSPKLNGLISSTTNVNANGKRNILEIAHQLSKRSKLEKAETENSTTNTSPIPVTPKSPKKETKAASASPSKQIIINNNFSSGGSISIKESPKKLAPAVPKLPIPRLPVQKVPTPKLSMPIRNNNGLLKFSNYAAKLANSANAVSSSQTSPSLPAAKVTNISPNTISKIPELTSKSPCHSPNPSPNLSPTPKAETIHGLTPNQILEKYNITNLAQFNANLNHAQLAFQQALMVSHQLEMHRLHQQTNQKQWINNPNILAQYENYVKSLKQQNQMCGNASKN